jgi:hypothetical protein
MPASENNEPVTAARAFGRYNSGHLRQEGKWQGNEFWFRGRCVTSIVRDDKYTQMRRVKLPDGSISDMVNLTRAKDAAISLVIKGLQA